VTRYALISFTVLQLSLTAAFAAPTAGFYDKGVQLYKAGRYSDATESFEQAIRRKENPKEAQAYIERIRKETVERIRNSKLTGVSKTTWQTKYFFMKEVEGKVKVGISSQEVFERDSTNFRPGAIEALNQVASAIAKSDGGHFEVELINEINQEVTLRPEIKAEQLTAIFSYLSLASRNQLPKFNP
jgi:hypothetical protein